MNRSAYLITVLILGCAFTLICFLLPEQVTQTLRKETLEVLGPVLRVVQRPVHALGRMDTKLKTLSEAEAEVARLKEQVATLTVQNQLLSDKTTENARLREMLGYRDASPFRLRACRVLSRDPSSWYTSVQVDVGWADDPDLAKDQPVLSPRGVVGKTGEVSQYVTDVILMVNPNCSISATVENPADPSRHDQGIVQGQGNYEEAKARVKINYLPKDSQVAVGQFAVTSGLGPYFPAGLRLGTVTEVPPLNNAFPTFGLYREAVIEPTADLNKLDELFIVLGPKQGDKQTAKPDANGTAPDPTSPDANNK